MKNIQLSYSRSSIEESVGEFTSYSGVKNESEDGGATFRRVATVAEDSRLLSGFLSQACSVASDRLRSHIVESSYDGNELKITFDVSDSFKESSKKDIERSFREFAVAFAVARWMRLAWREKAEDWDETARRTLLDVERHLCHREPPKRRMHNS